MYRKKRESHRLRGRDSDCVSEGRRLQAFPPLKFWVQADKLEGPSEDSKDGATIVNATSITAYMGHPKLMDYAPTKGAVTSFTRSLSESSAHKGTRVNAVARGPVRTPLIQASFSEEKTSPHGENAPMKLAGTGSCSRMAAWSSMADRGVTSVD